jgi:hypothetical protein
MHFLAIASKLLELIWGRLGPRRSRTQLYDSLRSAKGCDMWGKEIVSVDSSIQNHNLSQPQHIFFYDLHTISNSWREVPP